MHLAHSLLPFFSRLCLWLSRMNGSQQYSMRAVIPSHRRTRKSLLTTCRSLEGNTQHPHRVDYRRSIPLLSLYPSPDQIKSALHLQR
ncbi:hypothetical protein BCR34DRAFT_90105 [Clohesyomyces aquaticus]|uniref:Secreted protein n=1 Tax=Clohesyomyces aquaticus TaxID=1231657 RepID=A0A1Y1YV37_9PLEO|nr:hypothetical protein BCR34DRAFT_90105 [Clohesyomyces aquaticus]